MDDLSRQPVADHLTHRELETLRLIADGRSNQEIAERLFITLGTVKWYLKQIYGKLGVASRTQAIAAARAAGLLDGTGTSAKVESAAPEHNLPAQATVFVGREAELAELAKLLTSTRLVTILGPGGMGKTRLALEAAQAQIPRFANGVFFVLLAPLSAPESIILAIAEAVRFSFYGDSEPKQQLCDFLRAKHMLLVLDNIEHLLAGVGLVTEILQTAPRVSVLATSRERLNIDGETLFRLEEMDFPDWETPEDAAEYSAVKLFLQSARRVQPAFALDVNNLKYVARICRLVQGMPLGILLAAAWVETLSLPEIAQEIEKSLGFLETDQRDLPERQRSLRAAFDYSWNLLTDTEREIFKKLSVFRGGFTREAAQEVADASLKTLMTLVNKSLLGRNAATGRYDIHELLHQFGEQQLDASPSERESVHDLHCAYYAHYMQGQWKVLMSLNQVAALNEIRVEFNNVLAAWNDAIEKRKTGILRGMALPFWNYCDRRTPYAEAAILFERASEALQAASPDKDTEVTLGLMLAMQGSFNDQQLTPQGKALAEKSLVILRKHDCPEEMVVALYILAMHIGYSLRQFAEGEQVAQEALHVAQENHIQWAIGRCLFALGYFLWAQGDLVQARQIGEEGFRASEAYGELYIVAGNGVVLGLVALDLQDYARAEQYLEQGLRWCKELENGWESAGFCLYLGQVTLLTQDLEKAKYWLQQTVEYLHKTGKTRERLFYETLCTVSKLFTAQGRQEDAVALLSLVKHQANERSFTNPADYPYLSELATSSLTDLQASLPGEIYVAAVERGKLLDFDSVVAEFLAN